MKITLDNQSVFLCEAVENDPTLTMQDCPAHKSGTSWVLTASFAIAAIIIGLGTYMAYPKEQKQKPKNLDEEEQKVYNLLKEKEGSTYQSHITKELNISKVKTTRILDRLEKKKIIERKRRGMTNLVVLK